MTKRKQSNQNESAPILEKKGDTVRLRSEGEVLELIATAEFPIQVLQSEQYGTWISGLTDSATRARITNSVSKMRRGLFGDWKEVGAGVFEMRMDFGPGYRAYDAKQERIVVILLGGGEKSSQQKDIADAKRQWEELKNEITQV